MHSVEEGEGRPLGVGNVLDLSMGAGFTGVLLCENSRAAQLRFMLFPTYVLCSIKKKRNKTTKKQTKGLSLCSPPSHAHLPAVSRFFGGEEDGFEGLVDSLIHITVHITVTGRLWWARHWPRNTDTAPALLASPSGGGTGGHTQWEEKQVLYLASTTIYLASVEQEMGNSTGTKGISIFSTRLRKAWGRL